LFQTTLGWLLEQVFNPQVCGLDNPEKVSLKAGIAAKKFFLSMFFACKLG
jgi:hypothetical protein